MIGMARRDAMRLSLLLGLASCTGLDRAELSEFHRIAPDRFEYRASTNYFYVSDSHSWAEGQRLRWLETYLDLNAICSAGYELTSRRTGLRYASPLGYPVDDIVYEGRCRP
jgi:hypothetical protein